MVSEIAVNLEAQSLLQYACGTPYFWQSIGFVAAVGMLIGAIIFDGHLKLVQKAIVSTFIYMGLLTLMNVHRILSYFSLEELIYPNQAFASIVTTVIVTLCYCFGMLFGVWILSRKKEKYETNRSS